MQETTALSELKSAFILHFGEMGSRWGINRTVGQIYALLFLSEEPLCAEDIVTTLGFSRSNVSMGLKELQGWNLVTLSHRPGDRRDFYATPEDLWAIVRTLATERRKREIDPTLSKLRTLSMAPPSAEDAYAHQRITEARDLIEDMTQFHDELDQLETERLVALLKAGRKLQYFVQGPSRVLPLPIRKKG